MRALSSGKHVLVEKPMADTPQEAQQMIELAASKNLVLLEAIHYTYVLMNGPQPSPHG